MTTNKPTILVYVYEPDRAIINEIQAGMEEEGVLFEIIPKTEINAFDLAFEAANESVLGSGIGISGKEVVLQMRNLNRDKPVFRYHEPDEQVCRKLGANSARAVKKMPFKI